MKTDKYGFLKELLVMKGVYKIRLDTCRSCDSFQKHLRMCKECGCFMPAKARALNSTCPRNKW
jgi:hypothetical protein